MREKQITQKQAMMEHGKLPPQAIDLEEMVLGAIMLESNKCLSLVVNELSPDVFYKEPNQVIYRAILSLYDKNQPIDILTVTSELKSTGNLELSGGAFYITQLTSRIASSANIEYHTGIIIDCPTIVVFSYLADSGILKHRIIRWEFIPFEHIHYVFLLRSYHRIWKSQEYCRFILR